MDFIKTIKNLALEFLGLKLLYMASKMIKAVDVFNS